MRKRLVVGTYELCNVLFFSLFLIALVPYNSPFYYLLDVVAQN